VELGKPQFERSCRGFREGYVARKTDAGAREPHFSIFSLMLYPPQWIADPTQAQPERGRIVFYCRRKCAGAHCGLASIRPPTSVIADLRAGSAVKKNDGKSGWGSRAPASVCRGYVAFAEIRDMIARTAFTQLHYSFVFLAFGIAGFVFATFLLPWILFFAYPGEGWVLGDTAIALMTATFSRDGAVLQFISSLGFDAAGRGGFYGYATCVSAVRTGSAAVANGKAALKPRAATNLAECRIQICSLAHRNLLSCAKVKYRAVSPI